MAKETKPRRFNWRLTLSLVGLALIMATAAMGALKVRNFVSTDPEFNISRDRKDGLQIEGLKYAPRAKVLRVFTADFGRSVFAAPLEERRRNLLAINWVEDASVSRIWPDRLVVRIRERKPVAFVLFHPGVLLIDSDGVLLDRPPQAQFSFPVLSGIHRQDAPEERRERVRAFLRVEDDMGYLAKDVSEIDAGDVNNIRIVAQVGDRAVELLLGDSEFGRRYQNFLNHYPEIRKRAPEEKRFDLRLDDWITAQE